MGCRGGRGGNLVANSFAFPRMNKEAVCNNDTRQDNENHPGRLQGKFSFKKVVRMIEVQHDTDGHGALRLYISKIF